MDDETFFNKLKPYLQDFVGYYYGLENNAAGGRLHIVLDDGNLEPESIWFCQEGAMKEGDTFGYFLATLLRYFTMEELEAMYKNNWGMKNDWP